MASTYLTRPQNSTGSETTGTFSAWVKRSGITTASNMYTSYQANNEFCDIQFNSSDQLQVVVKIGGTDFLDLRTTRLFRDTLSFYHVLVAFDSTDGTQADRCKIYVNGTRETSFATNTNNVSSSLNMRINGSSQDPYIGSWHNQGNYFSGVMSHVHWVDGTAYLPTVFGETDATTGEWKIKTNVTATYGTNGFFILKDGNSVTDQSGNSNNFTVAGGTLTNTEDNPSNVFATLNPLYNQTGGQGVVLLNGNTRCSYNSDSSRSSFGTIAVGTGKYYFEAKLESVGTAPVVGVVDLNWSNLNGASGYAFHDDALNFGYSSSGVKTSGGVSTAYGDTFTAGDIIGVAIDKTNNKLYFAKNGVWQNSADPTSGATGTGSAFNLASDTLYTSACRIRNGGDWSFNFGNGFFSTTAISSEGTNASGNGKFEYDVPTGYTALSTKGLNL
jgi:hypothetical protein